MLNTQDISQFIASRLEGTELFLVEATVSPANDVVVTIDGPNGVDIDTCVELSRAFEQAFSRDEEDYSLEIGGAGITAPFKVLAQYTKNLGREVEVLLKGGKKLRATLLAANADTITLRHTVKTRVEGQKKPVMQELTEQFPLADVIRTSLYIDF